MPIALALICVGATVLSGSARAQAAECPNEAIREQQGSTYLPECRAFERVTPAAKLSGRIKYSGLNVEADPAGDSVIFRTETPFPASSSGATQSAVKASRGSTGWAGIQGLIPLPNSTIGGLWFPEIFPIPELTGGVISAPSSGLLTQDAPQPDPSVINAAWVTDLYIAREGRELQEINPLPPESQLKELAENFRYSKPFVYGASSDLSRVVFGATGTLLPGVEGPMTAGTNLYEWHDGTLELLGTMPNGEKAAGSTAGSWGDLEAPNRLGNYGFGALNAVSLTPTESRVYFNAPVAPFQNLPTGQLYLKENGAQTIEVSRSVASEPDSHGGPFPARFEFATPEGRTVIFASNGALTDDANTGTDPLEATSASRANLYRYDVGTHELTDLTPTNNPVNDAIGAGVTQVVAASEDGSRIYFLAHGALVPGQGRLGAENLYLYADGHIHFVGVGAESGPEIFESAINFQASPNGEFLGIQTSAQLTEASTVDANGVSQDQIYRYSAASGTVNCVSCTQAPPTSGATFNAIHNPNPLNENSKVRGDVTDEGNVVFQSNQALVPGTNNGAAKVYEWHDGILSKISTGDSPFADVLEGGTAGQDVFFTTRQQLVPSDIDNSLDLYDARIDGGVPEESPRRACGEGSCRPESTSPSTGENGGSNRFVGPGYDGPSCIRLSNEAKRLNASARRERTKASGARAKHQSARADRISHRARSKSERARRHKREAIACKNLGGI